MKIAFVGKGGSGKSTVSTLFFQYLLNQQKQTAFFDADLNIHIPELLGIEFDDDKRLSSEENAQKIRQYLLGNSQHIKKIEHFYSTTPPSTGVNLFNTTASNPISELYGHQTGTGSIFVVGTYQKERIGVSCYHENLSILENILSFSATNHDEWILTDMVAGIDSFANTLHLQFDVLLLVVEPSNEGIQVFNQYYKLCKHAGIEDRLMVVGNKVEDIQDIKFIASNVDKANYLGSFDANSRLRKNRQQNIPLSLDLLGSEELELMAGIAKTAETKLVESSERLTQLHQLHLNYTKQDYVTNSAGDLSGQIDQEFVYA